MGPDLRNVCTQKKAQTWWHSLNEELDQANKLPAGCEEGCDFTQAHLVRLA